MVEVVVLEVDLLLIISRATLLIVSQNRVFTGLEQMILLVEMLVRCLTSSKLQTTANQGPCSIQNVSLAIAEFSVQLAQLAFTSTTTHLESALSAKINQGLPTMLTQVNQLHFVSINVIHSLRVQILTQTA